LNDYDQYDALGLAELVRRREVSARDLLAEAIKRVELVDGKVNSVVTPMHSEAEAFIASGEGMDGPFAGVPFLLKDLRATYAGVPTTAGSRLLRNEVAQADSELVVRHKRAGLVIFGKTNTPEFACCPSTEGMLFGATRNPWNLELSAGGSSGGAAAAVAAGIVPAAHGSDGGGSIRIPAACCGLFGFKPSRGLNPSGPAHGEAWNGLSQEHAITRSVRDSAALLDATAGPAPGDPYFGPPLKRSLLVETMQAPGRLRVAVQREALTGAPVHPDCLAAVDATARLLEDLGHTLEEAVPDYDVAGVGAAFPVIIAANVQAQIDQHVERTGQPVTEDQIERVIRILADIGHQRTAADMARAIWTIHRVGRQVAPFFQRYDVLLSPVVATPPPPLGVIDTMTEDINLYLKAVFEFIPFTALANQSGLPAMSVPLHWNDADIPIGVHFMAGLGGDGLLFRLAAQLEQARPWSHRRAPVHARQ
jgi:amidase